MFSAADGASARLTSKAIPSCSSHRIDGLSRISKPRKSSDHCVSCGGSEQALGVGTLGQHRPIEPGTSGSSSCRPVATSRRRAETRSPLSRRTWNAVWPHRTNSVYDNDRRRFREQPGDTGHIDATDPVAADGTSSSATTGRTWTDRRWRRHSMDTAARTIHPTMPASPARCITGGSAASPT